MDPSWIHPRSEGRGALGRTVPTGSAVEGVLDGLAGGEPGNLGRRNRDRRAGLRIAALALAPLGDPEGAEAGDADLLAPLQRLGDGADQRLHGLAGIGQAGVRRDGRDQICLVHECKSPLKRLPTLAACPSSANWLPSGQHQYADKAAFQGSFQAVVAPGLHCGGTVAPVIGAGAAPDLEIALGAQATGEASSGNAGSRLAKKSP
jgi:hypothetical protein